MAETASTNNTTSGYFFTTSAISSNGFINPVEVSLNTKVTASYFPVASFSSTMSGFIALSHSISSFSHGISFPMHILCHLPENAPFTKFRHFFSTVLMTLASITPVEEEVNKNTGFSVYNSLCNFG